jgi:hypothetical protein
MKVACCLAAILPDGAKPGQLQRLVDLAIRDLRGEFKALGSLGWKPGTST